MVAQKVDSQEKPKITELLNFRNILIILASSVYIVLFSVYGLKGQSRFYSLIFKPVPILLDIVLASGHANSLYQKLMLVALILSILGDELIAMYNDSLFVLGATVFGFAHFCYIPAFITISTVKNFKILAIVGSLMGTFIIVAQFYMNINLFKRVLSFLYIIDLTACVWRGLSLRPGCVDRLMYGLTETGMLNFAVSDLVLIVVQFIGVPPKPDLILKVLLNILYFFAQFCLTQTTVRYEQIHPVYGNKLGPITNDNLTVDGVRAVIKQRMPIKEKKE